jgi:glycosyltransferase involved in cell wall biosynthesis
LARKLAKRTGLDIEINKKGALSHEQMLNLFSRSAVYVGLSESDGISTSLLEAMAMGAVPVQTSTACCDEWFSEETGVAIKNIEAGEVSKGILRALELAKLGLAAQKNRETIRNKASESFVKEASLLYYR